MFGLTKKIYPHYRCSVSGLFIFAALLCTTGAASGADQRAVPETGTIYQSNHLRLLYFPDPQINQAVIDEEIAMIEDFAEQSHFTVEWVPVDQPWQLISRLLAGEGDIIIGQGESFVAGMQDQVRFTSAWLLNRQQIVVRADTTQIDSIEDLLSRQVALKKSSPYWAMLEDLARKNRGMDLVMIPESLDQETVMQRVAIGQYDVTIADSLFLDSYLPQHKELTAAFDLIEKEARVWAVHPEASELQHALNRYLNRNLLHRSVGEINLDDLPTIQDQNILRVITYQDPTNYFFDDGRLQGFEYEIIRRFAKENRLRVDMVIARTHQEMQDLLLQGKGDIIAASLPANSITNEQITLSVPYNYVAPVIVGHESDSAIYDVHDLEGRYIFLSAESPYRNILEKIRDRGINFEIIEAGPGVDTKELLHRVAAGIYDLTLIGGHQLKAELAGQSGIRGHFSISEPVATVWAVRSSNTLLLSAVNDYLEKQYRSKFYNLLYSRYFERPRITKDNIFAQLDQLSPYDQIIREYAEEYDFDWRLIVAQMYQESQFNPEAISDAGAEGLMQIMPDTAKYLGTEDVYSPKNSIKAGVKYLGILRDKFENNLLLEDRIWFSLASYNAGYNRVKRARRIAEDMGLDGNRWFGHVEKAMWELAKPYKKEGELVRNCRCGQTIAYVREIRTLYNNYVRLTETVQIASNETIRKPPYDI